MFSRVDVVPKEHILDSSPHARIRRDDSSRVGHSTRESIRRAWNMRFHRAYEASARRAPSPIDGPAGRCLRQSRLLSALRVNLRRWTGRCKRRVSHTSGALTGEGTCFARRGLATISPSNGRGCAFHGPARHSHSIPVFSGFVIDAFTSPSNSRGEDDPKMSSPSS